ncbi:PKD domain-containing protein [Actinotalea solisilvae]|uniref:PKD domain-containing protein n=1 Tax=Actinotalea solisilvae TaxID=2072922 RepID=UPI0018F1DB58|nr:PKD domain-containing protein [Actinotalea solisilvae]
MARRSARTPATVLALVALGVTVLTAAPSGSPGGSAPAAGPVAAAGVPGTVTLTAAGDYAQNANTRAVLTTTASLAPDANIALGDLSYGDPGGEQAWCDLVTEHVGAGFPFELVAGNHESNGQDGHINEFAACLPNQLPGMVGTYGRQWYVDVPAADPLVRLIAISPALTFPDGTYDYSAGTPRYQWTAAAIADARADGVPWVVVSLHKPCVSLGEYSCDPGTDLTDLLLSTKVDLVLNGHEHLYQRTHQLALRPGCASLATGTADTDCVADADATMVRGAGTVFATVGTGGQSQRAVDTADGEAPYFAASSGLATATWGVLAMDVTETSLSARFVRATGGSFTDAFTITAPTGGNVAPTSSFTSACTALACSFDGSASSDPDGTVASWSWDLGDGATATGATVQHTYATAGTRQVVLTVTDDDGATATATRTVSVTATAPPFAADAFGRTVATGLGTADVGGVWRVSGSTTQYAVASGAAQLKFSTAGRTLDAALPDATSAGTDLALAVSTDKPVTGGGVYLTVGTRRVAGIGEYRANVRLRTNGVVALGLARTAGSTETALVAPAVVPGLTLGTGEQLLVRTQAVGAGPTTLRARVWRAGTPEPTTWQVSVTDATAGLQAAGSVGLNAYLSSSTTNAPFTVRVDDLVARTP